MENIMKQNEHFLYDQFPREIGIPYRITVHTMKGLLDIVNDYNTIKHLYFSLYQKINNSYQNVYVDKIFFDFDGETAIINCIKLHKFCMKENIKHVMFYSGGGFHIYVKCKKTLMNSTELRKIHHWFEHKANVEIDKHIIGDTARISRIPNTYNIKRKRYCIPITNEDLQKGLSYIREKAKHQHFGHTTYCHTILNPKFFKTQQTQQNTNDPIVLERHEETYVKIKEDIVYKCLRPCIQQMCQPNAKWRHRFHIIVEIMNLGFSYKQCVDFLHSFLSKQKFHHCTVEERQPAYVYKKQDFEQTNCEVLTSEQLCIPSCGKNVKF